jgi:signal transduction histidine kinase
VTVVNRRSRTRSGLRLPRRTVRLRLTVLYSLLFLLAGTALLAITYLLASSAPIAAIGAPPFAPPGALGSRPHKKLPPDVVREDAQLKAQAIATRASDMHHLLIGCAAGLAVMAVLAIALGWLVAGRLLAPLRSMTASTRRITEHNMHERLALPGPSDEIKDLADTIDGLLQRLEAAFDAQRRFVANASHELRTPLTLNRALLEVTLADPAATARDLRAMAHELIASGQQQEQLIEALLTLAASTRGLDRHEPFDLSDITAEVLRSPHPEISQLGLEVQTDITAAPATGDPRLARHLVANLYENALRHNVSGGHIAVSTRTQAGYAVLTIANSGPVIAQADIERLFQPFQRLQDHRASSQHGYGLGLSIVQAIAAAHNAALAVCARPGGGLEVEARFLPPPVPAAGTPEVRARERAVPRYRAPA